MNAADWVTLAAYASLAVELLAFPIPSEASTWQLFLPDTDATRTGGGLQTVRGLPGWRKAVAFLLPTAFGVVAFALPPASMLVPELRAWSLPCALPAWCAWVGIAAVVAGRTLTFAATLQLRAMRAAGGLRAGGLFARSRNPGLVGMFVFLLGMCLLWPGAVLWLALLVWCWNMHRRVLLEEDHLRHRHGDAHAAYAARVRRYL